MRTLKLPLFVLLALTSVGGVAYGSRWFGADSEHRLSSALAPSNGDLTQSIASATRQVTVEDQLRQVLTILLREAPTRFAVLRGDRIQVKVHKSVITGSRSIVLTENPGPISGDATIFDFPPNQDFGGSSIHHLRYTPTSQSRSRQDEFLSLKRQVDDLVPKQWVRGGRGASEAKPRWALECSSENSRGIEVVLDSEPNDQMGLVSRPTEPAIDLTVTVVSCESKNVSPEGATGAGLPRTHQDDPSEKTAGQAKGANQSEAEVATHIRTSIARYFRMDTQKVLPSTTLRADLDADELDIVELALIFEKEFGIEIPDSDVVNWQIVQDVSTSVWQHTGRPSALSAQAPGAAQKSSTDEVESLFARAALLSFAELRATLPCRTIEGRETFVPLSQDQVDAMLKVAKVTASDRIFDLTYGNGLLATTAATRFGARVAVIPICARGLAEARASAATAAVANRMTVLDQDPFTTNLNASVVTLRLLPALNDKLFPKLMRELAPGTRVVSYGFSIRGWEPHVTMAVGDWAVYMWTVRPGGEAGNSSNASASAPSRSSFSLSRPRIYTMTNRAGLGTFPRSGPEEDLVIRQLNVLIESKQQILECNYGSEGTGFVTFEFWYKTAPPGIREILRTLPGTTHPFWLLGVNGLESCPATRELARNARQNGLLSR